MQEALIRKAVDELMYYPVVPGGSDALKAPYKYKDVAKSQLEGKHFQEAGDYEEALKLWSAVEAPTPELRYNLGVLHLRRASLNLKDRLPD
ncbi:MAG: hypothetical protein HC888_07655, partial [Candidatus Competibacteraceae bacterium]|nr:hypothetical protein [Candidatus Competibacteraceae bacterium]